MSLGPFSNSVSGLFSSFGRQRSNPRARYRISAKPAGRSSFSFEPAFDSQFLDRYADGLRFIKSVFAVFIEIGNSRF